MLITAFLRVYAKKWATCVKVFGVSWSYVIYPRTGVVNVNFRLGWQNNRGGFSLGCFLWVRGLYLPSASQELHGVKHSLTLKIPLRSTTGASHPGLYSARR